MVFCFVLLLFFCCCLKKACKLRLFPWTKYELWRGVYPRVTELYQGNGVPFTHWAVLVVPSDLLCLCVLLQCTFFKKKANSSKAAWEESLFYGGSSLLPERLGEGRSINSWKKTGRESRVFSLCPLEMRCACNRERNVLLAGPQQKGWWGSETKICTAFGITGTDVPDRSLGWLGEGKHTLPNSSERSKWKQLNTQKTHWKAWEDAPAASLVFVS